MPSGLAALNPKETAALESGLRHASQDAVKTGFQGIRTHLSAGSWLGTTNRYSTDVIKTLGSERKALSHDGQQLAEYIAASCPLHCLDGWSFLAGATNRLLAGDRPVALHLAYYAELRAGMSLLGSLGIGVFNMYHVALNASLDVKPIRLLTHKFAWAALQRWAQLRPDTFPLGTIKVNIGAAAPDSIDDWLRDVVGSVTGQLIVANLLEAWSIDLQVLAEDQELRNTVSYRPTRLNAPASLDIGQFCAAVVLLCRSCEPGGAGSYRELDRHLLRLALQRAYGSQPKKGKPTLAAFVEAPLKRRRDEHDPLYQQELEFLSGTLPTSISSIFDEAEKQGSASRPDGVLPVLARAVLLLRIASAGCAYHIQSARLTAEQARFWWERLGDDLGLWNSAGPPSRLEDLWDDVKAAVDLIEDDLNRGAFARPANLWEEPARAQALHEATAFQKAGLWSLGLA